MRILTFLCLLSFLQVNAQNDLQFIKIKNDDRTIDLSVINHSSNNYVVSVKLELLNLRADNEIPGTLVIGPRERKTIAHLTPTSSEKTHYLISYKINEKASDFTYEPSLTIYTKNKNKRSTQLLIYLNQNGIAYNEINVSYNGDTKAMYERMLARRGISKDEARIPVVIYRGQAFHNIKNVKKFCKDHLAEEGRFIKKKDRKY